MKKILIVLFVLSNLITIPKVQAENNIKNDIYSNDYPNDYEIWINSTLVNRMLNELSIGLDLEYELDNMVVLNEASISISFDQKVPDKINTLSLSADEGFILIRGVIKSKDINHINLDNLLDNFIYILAPDMPHATIEEVKKDVSEWDFINNTYSYTFTFSRGVKLSISRFEQDSLTIIATRNFEDDERLKQTLVYSEIPENQNSVSLETFSFDLNAYMNSIENNE